MNTFGIDLIWIISIKGNVSILFMLCTFLKKLAEFAHKKLRNIAKEYKPKDIDLTHAIQAFQPPQCSFLSDYFDYFMHICLFSYIFSKDSSPILSRFDSIFELGLCPIIANVHPACLRRKKIADGHSTKNFGRIKKIPFYLRP